jgi:hemerythrin-like metal-binding protein
MDLRTEGSALVVGVRILDSDHREIADAILDLQTAAAVQEDSGRIRKLLNRLRHFTLAHFALEEGMMAATRYPKLAMHQFHHQRMAAQMRALLSRFDGSHPVLQHNALSCLSEWHDAHVEKDDLQYGHWLDGTTRH